MTHQFVHLARLSCFALLLVGSAPLDSRAEEVIPSRQRLEEMAATIQSLLDARDRIAAEQKTVAAGRGEAAAFLVKGRELVAAGSFAEANRVLRQGYEKATAQVIGLRSGQRLETARNGQYSTGAKGDADGPVVKDRTDTTRAMLEAYRRIVAEKGKTDPHGIGRVEELIATTTGYEKAGRLADARRAIGQAYDIVTAMVASVRQGDRLVKTLKFDNPAEEYAYELDRNNSFRLLLKMARGADAASPSARQGDLAQRDADSLREQAEKAAAAGRYAEAVRLLEQATSHLANAIRASGLFIPG